MEITPATVPGTGHIYQIRTRRGDRLAFIDYHDGRRALTFYGEDDSDDVGRTAELEPDEADRLAELLHSRSLDDRLAAIERRLAELTAGR
ncbi:MULTISPECIES: hypothetical protein [Nonomuraea]|jgi:K+/H+ antiporter YhaU regulatory subunit KhtT|uniref:Potassium/proton antiporter subunit KhtT-like N-terminal domain-containing protein n=1 Tax=Nonomuraea ferruginea TaxID=46174 RepID=A0ABT4SZK1_9ACTN|nr:MULTISPECIES: hypothetical protein [Nonomuraea]MDA0642393.1 hypothetical protein [Nonomuraea ferruginea]TXK42515.1 hypothetical protein FR742_25740 [Nonomuraea sp. C10]